MTPLLWLLAGVCLHAGVNHILIGSRPPRQHTHILFGIQCLFSAIGTLAIAMLYVTTDVEHYLRLYRIANVFVVAFFACLPWVVAGYTGARPRWPAAVLSSIYVILLLVEFALPYGMLFDERPVLRTITLPWGDIVTAHANKPTVFLNIFWSAHFLQFAYVGWACARQYRRGRRRPALTLAFGMLPFAVALTVNVLISFGVLRFVFIGAFGFMAMVLLMSWGLSRDLQRTQERSQAILDNVPAVIWIKDLEGRYIYINKYFERLSKLHSDDVLGKSDYDLFPREHAELRRTSDRQVLESDRRVHVEERLALGNEQRTLLALKFPLREPDGSHYALCGISTDITDSKRTADAMRALAQSASAQDSARFFNDCVDQLARTYQAEYAFVFLRGESDERPRELAVCNLHDRPLDASRLARLLCDVVLREGTLHVERDVRRRFADPALEEFGAEGMFVAPLVSTTQRSGVVGVISSRPQELFPGAVELLEVFAGRIAVELDRIAAVDQLRTLAAQLEARVSERTAELEAFSYSVSHDLRTPLRAIDGFTALVMESLRDAEDALNRDHLRRVRDTVRRMDTLIEDLLQLAKVARHEIRREHIDLSALIKQAASRLQEQEPQRKVHIVVAAGMSVFGDPRLIAVVVDNLLGNAWKYTSRTEHALIEAGQTEIGGVHAFFVKDNGVGFDPAHADRLFQAFQRLHDTKSFAGTGVGLAIVARIIGRHNGKVWGESSPGSGAVFYFSLPRQ